MSCDFCKIVRKELLSTTIFEDDLVLAFVPLNQISPGHTILVPKDHFESILDIDEQVFQHFAQILKMLSSRLLIENQATGINILNASGKDAQQSVFHMHFHLVPRYPNDGLNMWIRQ